MLIKEVIMKNKFMINNFQSFMKLWNKFFALSMIITLTVFIIGCIKDDDTTPNDEYEPNNSQTEAFTITLGTWYEGYVDNKDFDWFIFTTSNINNFDSVLIYIQNLSEELEIECTLYNDQVEELVSLGGESGQSIYISLTTPGGTYYVKIFSRFGQNAGDYKLKVSNLNANDDYEPNEIIDDAYDLGTLPITDLNAVLISQYEADWYMFETQNSDYYDIISVSITNQSEELELGVELKDAQGNLIDARGGGSGTNLNFTFATIGGTFYIKIYSHNQQNAGEYILNVTNQDANDDYEPDNSFETAREITSFPSGNISGTIVTDADNEIDGDFEFFKVTLPAGKKILFTIVPETNNTALNINIYAHDQEWLSGRAGSNGQTLSDFVNNSEQTSTFFYIKLGANVGDNGNYTISFTEEDAN